jgi:hypothetical protein
MLVHSPRLAIQVQAALDAAYSDAPTASRRRRSPAEAIAQALVDRRVLEGAAVAMIIEQHPVMSSDVVPS